MDADIFSPGMTPKNFSRVDKLLNLIAGCEEDFTGINGGAIATAGSIYAKMVEFGVDDQLNKEFVDTMKNLPKEEMVWWKRMK